MIVWDCVADRVADRAADPVADRRATPPQPLLSAARRCEAAVALVRRVTEPEQGSDLESCGNSGPKGPGRVSHPQADAAWAGGSPAGSPSG